MIKRYLVAGAAAATLAGGAFAFAANLDVDSQTLASGNATAADACDNLDVSYETDYMPLDHTYDLSEIKLVGDTACAAHEYKVSIDDGSTEGVEFDGVLDVNGDDTITTEVVTADIDANDVEHVTAVATGLIP